MVLLHVSDVSREQLGFEVLRPDHVKVKFEKFLLAGKGMLLAKRMKVADAPSGFMALQQQTEHSHEMGFAAAEAAVQIAGLALTCSQRVTHEPKRLVEGIHELGRGYIQPSGLFGLLQAFSELENVVALVNALGDVEQLSDRISWVHDSLFLLLAARARLALGRQVRRSSCVRPHSAHWPSKNNANCSPGRCPPSSSLGSLCH